MSFVWATGVVVVFAVVVARLDLTERAREVGRRSIDCLAALRDPALDDDAKEKALRRQSLRLFGLLAILVGGSALALGLPLGAVALLELMGMASLERVLAVLQRIDFLAAVTVLGAAAYLLGRRT